MMLTDLALQDFGKFMLTKILCLLLLLALRRKLEADYPRCPLTPHPDGPAHPSPQSPPSSDGTGEKDLALQPPPPGGRGRERERHSKKPKEPEAGAEQDQAPVQETAAAAAAAAAEGKTPTPPKGEGKVEGDGNGNGNGNENGNEQTPLTEPPEGEGEVEGGRKPGQDPDPEDLPTGLALRLLKWEEHYNLLVQQVMGDLEGYWMRLKTPQ